MQLLAHKINQTPISQRRDDGYINATALCKASGKNIQDYTRLSSTNDYLERLSLETGIPVSKLVEVRKGKPAHLQGTWVHPQVAIHLAMWCSPAFAVQVTQWVVNWMQGNSHAPSLSHYREFLRAALAAKYQLDQYSEQLDLIFLAVNGVQANESSKSIEHGLATIAKRINWLSMQLDASKNDLTKALSPILSSIKSS
jgi:hypothetical protein